MPVTRHPLTFSAHAPDVPKQDSEGLAGNWHYVKRPPPGTGWAGYVQLVAVTVHAAIGSGGGLQVNR
ncbi:MAG TPA: hypothetical protein DCO75_04570 [Fibrobacteres bacterium]|nr:hypothetical protein [Fibrobacterota bacterium]